MTVLRAILLLTLLMATGLFNVSAQTGNNWVWARQAGGAGADAGRGIATDYAGNVYVGGTYSNTATFGSQVLTQAGSNGFLAKYDSAGSVVWAQSIGNSGRCSVADVAADKVGNTYLIGNFSGTATFGVSAFTSVSSDSLLPDGFVVKLNP